MAENRARYNRSRLRYPSDLTDEEWALLKLEIPPARRGGNKRTADVRATVNGPMYVRSPARSIVCIMRSTCFVASRPAESPLRPRPSSTAKA